MKNLVQEAFEQETVGWTDEDVEIMIREFD